ncbi:chorismate synthase [Sinanaerobacter chloroacetimidivorans]|uniref:Chorismate synthase n=1 Tax=Sinanaerobacter chloroacetimidivorans TaxID=2818044 RepID=A0A8J8B0F5_9FIRM|nr:chorismate synthase [Sinanaerobacter chloroacetimidivorans]MBR0596752.1 chorismate synthase [Sinanaerobacter chloroacetimidivorans]
MGSTWGNQLKISIYGESHGKAIGVVIDGFPAGFRPDMNFISREMKRRAPGTSKLTTSRKEEDLPELLSGFYDGITTGAPICITIYNQDMHSKDYEGLRTVPRPGHSDYTGQLRYRGYNDIRGGGHFSGRLTAPLVFAGALCKDFLKQSRKITIGSHLYQVGSIADLPFDPTSVKAAQLEKLQGETVPLLDETLLPQIIEQVDSARMELDSLGGIVECAIIGAGEGIGSPMFQNVESRIASLLYGVPAVKGIEFGLGFDFAGKKGSEVNDCFMLQEDQKIGTKTNYNGGILGGITTGMPILFKTVFKPTPSISRKQDTLNIKTGLEENLEIHGRHDPCIALRAPVVVEAAAAVAMMDLYLEAYGYDAG